MLPMSHTHYREYTEEAMATAMAEYEGEPLIVSQGHIFRDHTLQLNQPDSALNSKHLVLCLDGTGNNFGLNPFTNVLKLFRMLDKDDATQLCYYQPGIGVNFEASSDNISEGNFLSSNWGRIVSRADTYFAFTLKKHVIAAYNFLCRFYKTGDKIYLLGFSRGSFTARIIAGMIERIGLLNLGLEEMSSMAWDLYCNWENAGQPINADSSGVTVSLVDDFKVTFSRSETNIYFMGLWDTVNSVGLIIDHMFPYTIRSSIVHHVRHAVSVDERRSKFKQVLFEQGYPYLFMFDGAAPDLESTPESMHQASPPLASRPNSPSGSSISRFFQGLIGRKRRARLRSIPLEDVVELYFPGNHGDCGGGWARDIDGQSLSDVALRWILLQAIMFGIHFKPGAIRDFNSQHPISVSMLSCNHDLLSLKMGASSRHQGKGWSGIVRGKVGTLNALQRAQELETFRRANTRLVTIPEGAAATSELPKHPVRRFDSRGNEFWGYSLCWWGIELLPFGFKVENRYGEWKRVYAPNFGRHRKIGKDSALHWSLFYRLHYCLDYSPPNLPKTNLGQKFYELIRQFEHLYVGIDLKEFCANLTMSQIKCDWSNKHPVWSIIPDELQPLLHESQNL